MNQMSDGWGALLDHLGATHQELAPVRGQALEHLDQANACLYSEHGDARLRWTYAGLPELWLQVEVVRERLGVASSRIFMMNLEELRR
ncbi:MAG: hypothetical protein NTW86_03070 [Candidatus Sumerlaeota bacterium]|nr:hypothetical protein [Candidatus Sumerlaeota bacterium]